MKYHLWTLFVALGLMSCNLPVTGTTPAPLSTPGPDTPTSSPPTPTLVPIETLLAIPSATFEPTTTPRSVIASPVEQRVNCRFGPSVAYSVVGVLEAGRQAEGVGRSADLQWLLVRNPVNPSANCWLAAGFIRTVGNVEGLPVVEAPLATVTDIRVAAEPVSMNVPCGSFPVYITISAEVVTNGPSSPVWRWETSEGETVEKEPFLFLEGGSQTAQLYYRVNRADNYWVQLHVLAPNDAAGRANFKVTCVP